MPARWGACDVVVCKLDGSPSTPSRIRPTPPARAAAATYKPPNELPRGQIITKTNLDRRMERDACVRVCVQGTHRSCCCSRCPQSSRGHRRPQPPRSLAPRCSFACLRSRSYRSTDPTRLCRVCGRVYVGVCDRWSIRTYGLAACCACTNPRASHVAGSPPARSNAPTTRLIDRGANEGVDQSASRGCEQAIRPGGAEVTRAWAATTPAKYFSRARRSSAALPASLHRPLCCRVRCLLLAARSDDDLLTCSSSNIPSCPLVKSNAWVVAAVEAHRY